MSVVIFAASSLANHIGTNKSCTQEAAARYSFCDNHIAFAVSFHTAFTSSI